MMHLGGDSLSTSHRVVATYRLQKESLRILGVISFGIWFCCLEAASKTEVLLHWGYQGYITLNPYIVMI
jgi:hypothetical protein